MNDDVAPERHLHLRFPPWWVVLVVVLAVLLLLWFTPHVAAFLGNIDLEQVERPALLIFPFVVLDAVIPVLPSESLLTTASNLAAQPGSTIDLWRVVLAGALGAVVGDSLLYWLSRTLLRRSMRHRLEQAQQDPRVAGALQVWGDTAPLLIVFGRFVPGLRFVVGATMGLTKYPYPRFLAWDVVGGTLWAAYTCVFSYAVATVVPDMPFLSIGISVIVTTVLLALLYRPIKAAMLRSRESSATDARAETPEPEDEDAGQAEAQPPSASSTTSPAANGVPARPEVRSPSVSDS